MPAMEQKIFEMGLSVETVSLYLICCAIEDSGAAITLRDIRKKWNGSEDDLAAGVEMLEQKSILKRIASDGETNAGFKLNDVDDWEN